MNKLLYLGLGAIGLFLVIGGVGATAGTALLPIVGIAAVVGLWSGLQKGARSWETLALIIVAMFLLFGLSLKK